MKGIILAGGLGTRLNPITNFINKHLLHVYDKPMIFYPISILLLLGIKEILIITDTKTKILLKKNLKYPVNKINIKYKVQKNNSGIIAAMNESHSFVGKSKKNIFILGDNFFYGNYLISSLKKILKEKDNIIFLHKVSNPRDYGVAEIKDEKIVRIVEKPKKNKSAYAITGLYCFDNNFIDFSKKIKKSKRNELEITSLLNLYLRKKNLDHYFLNRGTTWLDMGTPNNLLLASQFVSIMQNNSNVKIAELSEIFNNL